MNHYSTQLTRARQTGHRLLWGRRLLFVVVFCACVTTAFFAENDATFGTQIADAATNGANVQAGPATGPVRAFDLLADQTGWVLSGDQLFWTADGGDTWREITPPAATAGRLLAVRFFDPALGWALLTAADQSSQFSLAKTLDAGAHWQVAPLTLDVSKLPPAGKAVDLTLLDAQHGWVTISAATSSNFSRGYLLRTVDGGSTWVQTELPASGNVVFVDAAHGWLTGGPAGEMLWRTEDGGATWVRQSLPIPSSPSARRLYPPLFAADGTTGLLPALVTQAAGQTVEWYITQDGGMAWASGRSFSIADQAELDKQPLSALDPQLWLMQATGLPVQPAATTTPFFANRMIDGGLSLARLDWSSWNTGWGLAEPGSVVLRSTDQGATWRHLPLPVVAPAIASAATTPQAPNAPLRTGSHTTVAQGAGFDVCDLPPPALLSTWYAESPYRIVNLYLGGVLRFCDNMALTQSTLEQLAQQGWKFVPTWVGPQAPCSVYSKRFGNDPSTAFDQGSAEAEAALRIAKALGLAATDGSGAVIYYDLESFEGLDTNCVAAAQAFVAGWTTQLHTAGSQAGLYGSACNPGIEQFDAGNAIPDAVWVAQWNRDFYDPQMTVWGIACMDPSLWTRSQRIRQYTGGHDETWGGVTLNIDSNVVDSLVADIFKPQPPAAVTQESPDLDPPYTDGMCGAGWYQLITDRGYPAYLAANWQQNGTIPPPPIRHRAIWQPEIPAEGYYRVEAYVPPHPGTTWECPSATLAGDTSTARYTIEHLEGTTVKVADQAAHQGTWLLLGVYKFGQGQAGEVQLEDATAEPALTRTVVASALRFTQVTGGQLATDFIYLPAILH